MLVACTCQHATQAAEQGLHAISVYPRGFALALSATLSSLSGNAVLGLVALIKHQGPLKGVTSQPLYNLLQSGSSTCITAYQA